MVKVITYGTYDMLHYGHIRLLERAKALGDYLIVGITSDDYDKTRGKINLQQSLMERVEAVKATGIADEIIIEEYEGQKIDDIQRYDIDIFTVGSDWKGYFDYLNDYCKVIYLSRTEGISSTEIRAEKRALRLGLLGNAIYLEKVINESEFVNGIEIIGVYSEDNSLLSDKVRELSFVTENYNELLDAVDAVYVHSFPAAHYEQVKKALISGKHVLCESPIALSAEECNELFSIAKERNLVLMEAIRTAYSTAYRRMLLLVKAGKIGDVISVDATCTSLKAVTQGNSIEYENKWNSISAWGPTALLPIFQILGIDIKKKYIISRMESETDFGKYDSFTKIDFLYDKSTGSIKVGRGIKSEGELVVSGTKGYIYIPAPWWKTDYFEVRYEDPMDNKRYFYQLDGEGIRYELVAFNRAVSSGRIPCIISQDISIKISDILSDYNCGNDLICI